jgi:hypothetical protein
MNKLYTFIIFILFGIILFLYYNNNETLSIGCQYDDNSLYLVKLEVSTPGTTRGDATYNHYRDNYLLVDIDILNSVLMEFLEELQYKLHSVNSNINPNTNITILIYNLNDINIENFLVDGDVQFEQVPDVDSDSEDDNNEVLYADLTENLQLQVTQLISKLTESMTRNQLQQYLTEHAIDLQSENYTNLGRCVFNHIVDTLDFQPVCISDQDEDDHNEPELEPEVVNDPIWVLTIDNGIETYKQLEDPTQTRNTNPFGEMVPKHAIFTDDEGDLYYYNLTTLEVTWEPPTNVYLFMDEEYYNSMSACATSG